MNTFKDALRLLALVLVARAVYIDSVACAICAGTLYMGGFDASLHIKKYLKRTINPKKDEVDVTPQFQPNVIPLHRTS